MCIMKVLLVQLWVDRGELPIYPLGLVTLAGILKNHDVQIFDPNVSRDPSGEYHDRLHSFGPDVVGISIRNIRFYSMREKRYIFYYEDIVPMIELIRQQDRRIPIIVGGSGFSMFPQAVLERHPEIDFGVYLDGEESLPELLENLENPGKVKGIFHRENGRVHFTGTKEFAKDFPPVNWALFPPDTYSGELEGIGILSKRGCILECLYCNYPFLTGNRLRLRSPETVVDEIEYLNRRYGVEQFTFADTVFNVPKGHAESVCMEIVKRNLPVRWTAWFNEKTFGRNFMDLAIRAGCERFQFSPDAFSDQSLKLLRKNISTQQILDTYQLMRRDKRARVSYNFMIGVPGENLLSFIRMLLFALRLKLFLRGRLVQLNFTKLRIEPNTGLEKYAREEGIITEESDLMAPTLYPSILERMKFFNTRPIRKLRHMARSLVTK